MATRDPQNNYPPLKANDAGTELMDLIIQFYRGHRAAFNSTEATNIGTAVVNILNGTNKV